MSGAMKALKGMFKPPEVKAPKVAMPDPESPASKLAARNKIEERRKRGREGTIYSSGSYGGSNLGGTA